MRTCIYTDVRMQTQIRTHTQTHTHTHIYYVSQESINENQIERHINRNTAAPMYIEEIKRK